MARFTMTALDGVISEMQRMGHDSDEVAQAMLEAGAIEIREGWREAAEKYGLHDTGAMIESVDYPYHGQTLRLLYRDIYPMGEDAKGVSNAEKAFILHYGSSHIKARYWVDDADGQGGLNAYHRIKAMWEEFLETGRVPTVVDPRGSSSGSGITKTVRS